MNQIEWVYITDTPPVLTGSFKKSESIYRIKRRDQIPTFSSTQTLKAKSTPELNVFTFALQQRQRFSTLEPTKLPPTTSSWKIQQVVKCLWLAHEHPRCVRRRAPEKKTKTIIRDEELFWGQNNTGILPPLTEKTGEKRFCAVTLHGKQTRLRVCRHPLVKADGHRAAEAEQNLFQTLTKVRWLYSWHRSRPSLNTAGMLSPHEIKKKTIPQWKRSENRSPWPMCEQRKDWNLCTSARYLRQLKCVFRPRTHTRA